MTHRGLAGAAFVLLLSACSSSTGAAGPSSPTTSSAQTTSPRPSHPSVPSIAAPSGIDAAFRVAAPVLLAPAGPGPAQWQRPCRPAQVTATASTRLIGGAVQGVIRLLGDHCSLHVMNGPTALLGDKGKALSVPLQARSAQDFAGDPRPDLPLAAGDVLWGFTWAGSWCGPRAGFVLVPLVDEYTVTHKSYGSVRARVRGDQLPCTAGSHATLTQGYGGDDAVGGEFSAGAEAVLPAPSAWRDLRATVALPTSVGATQVPAYVLTLSNPTGRPVTLLPCPDYGFEVDAGNSSMADNNGPLPCSGSMSIPSRGSLSFTLSAITIGEGQPHPYMKGTRVSVRVAIGGVPTATARSHIG